MGKEKSGSRSPAPDLSQDRNESRYRRWTRPEVRLLLDFVSSLLCVPVDSGEAAQGLAWPLSEIARLASAKVGRPVGRRLVHEVLREMRQDNPNEAIRVLPRGRPPKAGRVTPAAAPGFDPLQPVNPSSAQHRQVIPIDVALDAGEPEPRSHAAGASTSLSSGTFAFVCCEAIQLTGLSAYALHTLLKPWPAIRPYLKGKSSFYLLLATSGRDKPARRATRKPRWIMFAPTRKLTHELRVHQVVLRDKQILRSWLFAYDTQTHYIFAWCYKIDLGERESDSGWLVALPPSEIVHFVKRAWERQGIFPGLPITFTLNQSLQQSDEDIMELRRLAPNFRFRISEFEEGQYVPQDLAELYTAGSMKVSVSSFLNTYNDAIARPEIEAWREERAQDRRQLMGIQELPSTAKKPIASKRRRPPYSSLEEMNMEDQVFPPRTKDTFNQACTPEDISSKFTEPPIDS